VVPVIFRRIPRRSLLMRDAASFRMERHLRRQNIHRQTTSLEHSEFRLFVENSNVKRYIILLTLSRVIDRKTIRAAQKAHEHEPDAIRDKTRIVLFLPRQTISGNRTIAG